MIRGQRLEESLEYQQFVANVEEEEAWINEKMTLVASEDYGDTLAAIQVRKAERVHTARVPSGSQHSPWRSPCSFQDQPYSRLFPREPSPLCALSSLAFHLHACLSN